MHTVHRTPALALSTTTPKDIDADLVVVPTYEDEAALDLSGADDAVGGEHSRARSRGEIKGLAYEVFGPARTVEGWKPARMLFVGLGKRSDLTTDRLRRFGTTAGLATRQRRAAKVALVMPMAGPGGAEAVQAIAEGVVLANFDGASYKTGDAAKQWLDTVTLVTADAGAAAHAALERGRTLGECTNLARELSNEPGNALTPRAFAERAAAVAGVSGLTIDVLDESRIAELKMGLLLGVGRGSAEPPRVMVLRHEPKDAVPGIVLGLVGKGITFDSGGISIKPADKMHQMKDDMSGGAAVIGAMAAIARLGAPVRCIGVVAAAENMPGGRALKPGDVVRSAEGKTVEIINTDAEGRLILGDAVWYARHLGATHLVDVATLTGGCVVALGQTTAGLFGTPQAWADQVRRASERAGDRSWPMPVFDDYFEQMKSEIADMVNQGTRWGSAITGALFIKEFSGGLPWVHLDIAGPAWSDESKPYQAKGATGIGVRTLAQLALAVRDWAKA